MPARQVFIIDLEEHMSPRTLIRLTIESKSGPERGRELALCKLARWLSAVEI